MLRFLVILFAAVVLWTADAPLGYAQETATGQSPAGTAAGGPAIGTFARGPGHYLSIIKILVAWFLLLLWVKTSDWANQDMLRHRLNHAMWNPVIFFSFVAAFLLMLVLPWFYLGIGLMAVAYLVPVFAYVSYRNGLVPSEQKVMTPDHLRVVFANLAGKVGIKINAERVPDHEKGPPVKLSPQGGADDAANQINGVKARQSPGYLFARELLADAFERRAQGVMLDYSADSVGVRFQIDGVWHEHQSRDRESGDLMLYVMKTLAALRPDDRVARQAGIFGAEFKTVAYNCKIASQGVETGERVILQIDKKKQPVQTLEELGMRPKMQEQLKEQLAKSNGMVLLSAMPAGGLSTTFDSVLKAADRYVRDFVAVEDVNKREADMENVTVTTYNPAAKESPATVLPELIRKYPNVIVVRDITNMETASILAEEARGERLVITAIRAKECAEALLRVLMLKIPATEIAPTVNAVLSQRLVRKLCDTCKEAYTPPPEVFKQLGIPPGRVEVLYREPTQTEQAKICPDCQGLNYVGRTAIFELMIVDDAIRQAMIKTPKLDVLRTVARKSGMRTLQEEGIVLVVKGVTSIAELSRVLKQ